MRSPSPKSSARARTCPGCSASVRDVICTVFPDVADSGMGWLKGKSQQEIAKAAEIRAAALEKLGKLELERVKLINERDAAERKAQSDDEKERRAAANELYKLKTERLTAVVAAVKALKDAGVELSARTRKRVGELLLSALEADR